MKTFARSFAAFAAFAGLVAGSIGVEAAQVHVRPVNVQVMAPAAASRLTLKNLGRAPITAQVRVFRWIQKDGRDQLLPTREVVASPPLLRLRPGRENVVRIVRTVKRAVRGEESYRLIVDEIPDRRKVKQGVVFAVRYSIPVFFTARNAKPPKLSWQAQKKGRRLIIRVRNLGDKHARLSDMTISAAGGGVIARMKGLAGYVLGKSSMAWVVSARRIPATLVIRGKRQNGPFTAKVRVR